MNDSWWEVRAQGMCICADLLLSIAGVSTQTLELELSQSEVLSETNMNVYK
jgi:hypothetical protein